MKLKSLDEYVNENYNISYDYYGNSSLISLTKKFQSENKDAMFVKRFLHTIGVDNNRIEFAISHVYNTLTSEVSESVTLFEEDDIIDNEELSKIISDNNMISLKSTLDKLKINEKDKDIDTDVEDESDADEGVDDNKSDKKEDKEDKNKNDDKKEEKVEDDKDDEVDDSELIDDNENKSKIEMLQSILKDAEKLEKIKSILSESNINKVK